MPSPVESLYGSWLIRQSDWARLGAEGASVLIGISGGADSVALLHAATALATDLKMRVGAACIDHGLRPDSGSEVEAVRALCERLGVPFFTRRVELAPGADLEGRARLARYEALEAIRSEQGFDLIATAHTAEDQAETVLMRLGRGSSLRGVGGIRERNGVVIRPFLGLRREDVRQMALSTGFNFVVDPMNADPSFTRVRVRRELLPAMQSALGDEAVSALSRFAAHAHEDESLLSLMADGALERLGLDSGLDAVGLLALERPIARRVLRTFLEREGLRTDAALIDDALEAIVRSGQLTLPDGALLRTAGSVIRIVRAEEATTFDPVSLSAQWISHAPSGFEVAVDQAGGTWAAPVASTELVLRGPLPGDRVAFGKGGKLQDLLVDLRIPREQRAYLPIVVGPDGRVECIVGLQLSGTVGPHRVVARLQAGRAAPVWSRC